MFIINRRTSSCLQLPATLFCLTLGIIQRRMSSLFPTLQCDQPKNITLLNPTPPTLFLQLASSNQEHHLCFQSHSQFDKLKPQWRMNFVEISLVFARSHREKSDKVDLPVVHAIRYGIAHLATECNASHHLPQSDATTRSPLLVHFGPTEPELHSFVLTLSKFLLDNLGVAPCNLLPFCHQTASEAKKHQNINLISQDTSAQFHVVVVHQPLQ